MHHCWLRPSLVGCPDPGVVSLHPVVVEDLGEVLDAVVAEQRDDGHAPLPRCLARALHRHGLGGADVEARGPAHQQPRLRGGSE